MHAGRLLVQIGTYNANLQANEGLPQNLVDWLAPSLDVSNFLSRSRSAPDIVAIGFQELLPLHLGLTGLSRSVMKSRDELIKTQIEKHAPNNEAYVLVAKAVNVGIALLVYARDDTVAKHITDVQTQWSGSGPVWLGNKGAVGVRFRVESTGETDEESGEGETFTFVNAHLTAHSHNLERRIADYKHIVQTLLFSPPTSTPHGAPYATMYQTTHLFFFGDLNFRIEMPQDMNRLQLEELIRSTQGREELVQYDQLVNVRKKNRTLHGLREAEFWKFQCTYKYELGEVDTYSSKRVPSWTDRILYTTASDDVSDTSKSEITPLVYAPIPSYVTSDHKPVVALLLLPPSVISANSLLIAQPEHYTIDPYWRWKRYTGKFLGWIVGWVWCVLWFVGAGNAVIGVSNIVIGASLAWWKWGWGRT